MMKRIKLLTLTLVMALLIAALAGCADSPRGEQNNESITVTDMSGREVTLDAPAKRVVVINAADCEILYSIGAGDAVVGRGTYCNYPEEVNSVQIVPSEYQIDAENIIALEPDLVILGTMYNPDQNIPILEQARIKVIITSPATIEEVYTAIDLIGVVTGKSTEADVVIDSMKALFEDIKSKSKEANFAEKMVYFEISPLEYGLWTAGTGTFMDEFCSIIGINNAFSDVSGWAEISEEQVIERNPDYVVTTTMYSGEGQNPVEEILMRKAWQGIAAVRNKAVFNADSDKFSRPGPRLAEAAQQLFEFVADN